MKDIILSNRVDGRIPYLPNYISNHAVAVYIIALITCFVLYINYSMQWYWYVFGLVEVLGFFYYSNTLTKRWAVSSSKLFVKRLFWTAFSVRLLVMLFLYWFHNEMTGQPFMFAAADAIEYHIEGAWMAETIRNGEFDIYWDYKFVQQNGVSDAGYPMYLGLMCLISGDSIIFTRIIKCILGAFSCVLLYKLGTRNFGESIGRIAAILMMLSPHFMIYGGMHLKETEMIFLMLLFLERSDYMIRNRSFNFRSISVVVVLMALLFTFRTVLGLTALFSVALTLLLSSKRVISMGKRLVFLIVFGLVSLYFVGGRIASEVETVWELKDDNQSSRHSVIEKTQSLAKYASASVFAPMIFTIPFPTMVETPGQETSRMLHGAMVVKNIMSFFCILAIIMLVLPIFKIPDTWRNHVLIGSFLIAYLVILVLSAFAHSDRFHLVALPLELLFAAYGVSFLNNKKIRSLYTYWLVLMFVAFVAWNWFKLSGRGMI